MRFFKLEEEYWKQKSGMCWFKDRDRNTKFFHSYVKWRRWKMSKDEIPNNQRDIISGIQNIGEEIVKVFKEQFNEDRDDRE